MAAQERKLATILAMDVVGYSSKMNKNEAATVDQLIKSNKNRVAESEGFEPSIGL